jgi:hypothetical protein
LLLTGRGPLGKVFKTSVLQSPTIQLGKVCLWVPWGSLCTLKESI